jgi:flagellar basal body P-ring protein FlgI
MALFFCDGVQGSMKRLYFLLLASGIGMIGLSGCSWFNEMTMRSQSPEEPEQTSSTRLVGDIAVPTGMQLTRVEAIGIVVGLRGTGSDPAPSNQRSTLISEMQTRGVSNANALLASGNVSMVVLQAYLKPGIQKGDHFDVEVRIPSQSETTSLRGGYLLETRLMEMAVLDDNQYHHGKLLGVAKGPLMVDPTADPKKDQVLLCRARVLGGGEAKESRPLGLVLLSGHHNIPVDSKPTEAMIKARMRGAVFNSQVANAVNKRFNSLKNGEKTGVAKAVDDQLIELQVHPRYKDNIARYVKVIQAIPLSESAPVRLKRIHSLQGKLLVQETSAEAALQLEAIGGSEAAESLLKGIQSNDPEVRFYSAESLAYLDRREAAEPLGQIAREQPAFRVFALAALSAMQDFSASEQLRDMLSLPSAETRYGAFRSLCAMNGNDPLVKGETLGGAFHYAVLDVAGPPMIHVTRNRLAEIVQFGPGQEFQTPIAINAGNQIMITSNDRDEISVSKFSVADGDQKRIVSKKIDDVIRAVVELGGTYPDIVQALSEAKASGALIARFEVDALPEAGRAYDRVAANDGTDEMKGQTESEGKEQAVSTPSSPSPDLFYKKAEKTSSSEGVGDEKSDDEDDSDEKPNTKKGFFARMLGR